MKLIITTAFLSLALNSDAFTLNGYQKGWSNTSLAVNVNPTNCPADIIERLEESFALWNSVPTSSLKLSLGSTTSTTTPAQLMNSQATDVPLVLCDNQFGTTVNIDANSVAGVGFAIGDSQDSNISYGGLILNVQSGASASVSAMTTVQRSIVVAHELGHMLGLGHSSSEPALMYYSVGSKENFNLSKDDWDGMSYLYPRDELGKTQQFAGCGLVKNGPSHSIWLSLLFLLFPLLVYAILRFTKQQIETQ